MSLPKPLRAALWLLLCVPLFAACSPTAREAPIITKIERVAVRPPAELMVCPAEPALPADIADQDALAPLIVDLAMAGRACRDRLEAVRRFVEEVGR